MAQTVFQGASFKVTHTLEQEGPHPTRDAYYDESLAMTALIHGSGSCFVEGSCYPMAPGDLVLMRPDELRCCRFEQSGVHERISLYLPPSFFSSWSLPLVQIFQNRDPGTGNKISLKDGDSAGWSTLLELRDGVAAFHGSTDSMEQAELHLLILRLLIRLYRIRMSATEGDTPHFGDPAVENVCRYIRENLTETLTYQHIQEHCHVSRYQLGEVFRCSTGMTLTEYIIQKRLLRTAELVRGGAGIESAAAGAGFQTYSHFYKAFIRQKGMSPRQYFQKKPH